jgi:hypothetical protein
MEKNIMYEVLNPRGIQGETKLILPTPRLTDLKGKVVYCVSQHVGGADTFLKKVAEKLAKYAPGVKAVYADKASWYGSSDPELWDEIAAKGNAVIYAAAA